MLSTLIIAALALSAGAVPHSKTKMVAANEHGSKSATSVFHSAQTPHATADDDFFTDDAQGHLRNNKQKFVAASNDFYAPSAEPTATPEPSFMPTTSMPSLAPTPGPTEAGETFEPTAMPSHAPTAMPTYRAIETVTYASSQVLEGISCTDFDQPAQDAFVNVTATNMDVDADSIVDILCANTNDERRRLQSAAVQLAFGIEYAFDVTTQSEEALTIQVNLKFAATDQAVFAEDFVAKCVEEGSVGITASTSVVTVTPVVENVTTVVVVETGMPTQYPTRAPTGNSAPASATAASAMWVTMLCAAVASAVYLV